MAKTWLFMLFFTGQLLAGPMPEQDIYLSLSKWARYSTTRLTPRLQSEYYDQLDKLRLFGEEYDESSKSFVPVAGATNIPVTKDGFIVQSDWGRYRISCYRITGYTKRGTQILEQINAQDIFDRCVTQKNILFSSGQVHDSPFFFMNNAKNLRRYALFGAVSVVVVTGTIGCVKLRAAIERSME
jgi:hypothetical protein